MSIQEQYNWASEQKLTRSWEKEFLEPRKKNIQHPSIQIHSHHKALLLVLLPSITYIDFFFLHSGRFFPEALQQQCTVSYSLPCVPYCNVSSSLMHIINSTLTEDLCCCYRGTKPCFVTIPETIWKFRIGWMPISLFKKHLLYQTNLWIWNLSPAFA